MDENTSKDRLTDAPKPNVQKTKWPFPLIWLVPVAAAIGAAFYAREAIFQRGPEIVIEFVDANGLKSQDSIVSHRGVELGNVESIELAGDTRHARVHVRLHRDHAAFAAKGTDFWIVKADFGGSGLTGIGTIVSGAYIEAEPHAGTNERTTEFIGLDRAPIAMGDGLHLFLHTARLEHLEVDAPVKYKGIDVGTVKGIRLSDDASHVEVELFIQPEYSFLVRTGSKFWTVSPADVKGGVFSGIKVKLGSLQSLLSGAVSFATPSDPIGELASDGSEFALNSEEDKEWKDWSPTLQRPRDTTVGRIGSGEMKPGPSKSRALNK